MRGQGLLELFQPEDFTSGDHATIWQFMQIAQEHNALLTPITVAWAAEKFSPGVLTVSELTKLTREPSGDVVPATAVLARVAWMRYDAMAKDLPGAYARSGGPVLQTQADRPLSTAAKPVATSPDGATPCRPPPRRPATGNCFHSLLPAGGSPAT